MRWGAAVGTAAVLLCLGAGRFLRGEEPPPAEGPRPSGLWAVARVQPYRPKLVLPGEIKCPHSDKVMSHYRWWTSVKWIAPEGSRIEEGEVVAVVFHEGAARIAEEARRTARQKRAGVESREEREELAELEVQQRVLEAERALREAQYGLRCMEAGRLPEEIQQAELSVEEARLRVAAAERAVRRLEAANRRLPVSQERREELEHEHRMAVADLRLAEAQLAARRKSPTELELLTQKSRVAEAQARARSARRDAEANDAREAAETAALRREAAEMDADAEKWQDRLRTMDRRAGMSGLVVWQYPPGTASISPRVIATILDPSAPVFVGQATGRQVAHIEPGQTCALMLPSLGEQALPGRVVGVAVTGEDLSLKQQYGEKEESHPARLTVYDVLIQVGNAPGTALCQGMTGHAVIYLGEEQERLVVPAACVHNEDGHPHVLVQREAGPERRKVVLGPGDESYVVVRSGLRPGQRVAFPSR
ncbi:MAG: hypothetical protein PVJ27_04985 [Candidatus Brocadiaceae bacterium]